MRKRSTSLPPSLLLEEEEQYPDVASIVKEGKCHYVTVKEEEKENKRCSDAANEEEERCSVTTSKEEECHQQAWGLLLPHRLHQEEAPLCRNQGGGGPSFWPLQILSELIFQAFLSPKDMLNQTRIPYVSPNYTTKPWKIHYINHICRSAINRNSKSQTHAKICHAIGQSPDSTDICFHECYYFHVHQ